MIVMRAKGMYSVYKVVKRAKLLRDIFTRCDPKQWSWKSFAFSVAYCAAVGGLGITALRVGNAVDKAVKYILKVIRG